MLKLINYRHLLFFAANRCGALRVEADDGGPADLNKQQLADDQMDYKSTNQSDVTGSTPGEADSQSDDMTHTDNQSEITAHYRDEVSQSEESASDEDITDSEIDREIEEELQAMESQKSSAEQTQSFTEPVKVDWSDVTSKSSNSDTRTSSKHGALVLKSSKPDKTSNSSNTEEKTNTSSKKAKDKSTASTTSPLVSDSFKRQSQAPGSAWDSWEDSWENTDETWEDAQTSPKHSSHPESPAHVPEISTGQKRKPSKAKDGFDLSSLDIKSVEFPTSEPDFFADMAPKLELQGSTRLLDLLPSSEESSPKKNKRYLLNQ